jgi:predicted RND superfamily exporter protein
MALTLALVFRRRPRLLPLGVALAAAGLTFGALSLAGAVAHPGEHRRPARPHRPGRRLRDPAAVADREEDEGARGGRAALQAAVDRAAARGAPAVATAAVATAAGFAVLALSPVRWCAASACCSSPASSWPSAVR